MDLNIWLSIWPSSSNITQVHKRKPSSGKTNQEVVRCQTALPGKMSSRSWVWYCDRLNTTTLTRYLSPWEKYVAKRIFKSASFCGLGSDMNDSCVKDIDSGPRSGYLKLCNDPMAITCRISFVKTRNLWSSWHESVLVDRSDARYNSMYLFRLQDLTRSLYGCKIQLYLSRRQYLKLYLGQSGAAPPLHKCFFIIFHIFLDFYDDKRLPIMAGAGLGSCDDGAAGLQLWLSFCPKWKEHRLKTNC